MFPWETVTYIRIAPVSLTLTYQLDTEGPNERNQGRLISFFEKSGGKTRQRFHTTLYFFSCILFGYDEMSESR